MKILYIYSDYKNEWNSSEWRCSIPMLAINQTAEHQARMLWIDEFARNSPQAITDCTWADVLVLQRNVVNTILTAIEVWKSEGKTLIVDVDDDYFDMPMSNASYNFWINGVNVREGKKTQFTYTPLQQLTWGAKLCHGLTAPSMLLVKDWRHYGVNAHLVPNYTFLQRYLMMEKPEPSENVVIGWGGSLTHVDSFRESGVVTALNRVLRARPKVHFHLAGGDLRIIKMLDCPNDRRFMSPWMKPNEWPGILATFDIGIAPLVGRYDARRSWIKGMEYTIMGIPWVGTNAEPFFDVPTGRRVANKPTAWEDTLLDMIDHLEEEKAKAKEAQNNLTMFDIQLHVDDIIRTYAEIRGTHT